MKIDRIDHVVLTAFDVDRTIDFYTRVMGMEAITFAGGPTQEVLLPTTEDLPEAAPAAAQAQDEPEEAPSILEKPAEARSFRRRC